MGNMVVPQVAEWIGRRIMAAHFDGWEHDDTCESENIHGHDTPCWCEERAEQSDGTGDG